MLCAGSRPPDRREFAVVEPQRREPQSLIEKRLILRLQLIDGQPRPPVLCAAAGAPYSGKPAVDEVKIDETQPLIEVGLILILEFVDAHARAPVLHARTGAPDGDIAALCKGLQTDEEQKNDRERKPAVFQIHYFLRYG